MALQANFRGSVRIMIGCLVDALFAFVLGMHTSWPMTAFATDSGLNAFLLTHESDKMASVTCSRRKDLFAVMDETLGVPILIGCVWLPTL